MLSELDIYLFDLRGYLVIEDALSQAEVTALNAGIDAILPLKRGEWAGYVHGHSFSDNDGLNLQQIYEGGEPFERLIDHPSWIEKVKYFVGGEGTFDYHPSPLFIDENFANMRGPGGALGLHSGGHTGTKRTQFRYYNGHFQCGQINILMALTDIGPGDGATMVIPGSHKSHFPHPQLEQHAIGGKEPSVDGVVGAVEINMKAGTALLFVDALAHGSAERTNPGERRVIIFRYGPGWANFRHGYQPSPELVARLTPERRQFVQPFQLLPRQPQK